MKKVLVLGGNGFIGKNLVKHLIEYEYDVYSFDMKLPMELDERVNYVEGDFFDDYTLQTVIKGMDVIFHCICTLNPGNSNDKCIIGYERDLIQTIKLCSMVEKKTKIIFASSGGTVYGNQDVLPISENCIPQPINHYGCLKLCIENVFHVFKIQQNLDCVVARIANPYGPGQDYKKGVGFIDAVIKRALSHEQVEVWGTGEVVRDYIYIEDVCERLIDLIDYYGNYEVINISSGVGYSQNDIISIVKKYVSGLDVVYKEGRLVDTAKIVLCNERMLSINSKPIVPLEQGIKQYIAYCKQKHFHKS